MGRILQFNLLFSAYFDHSIQRQPKTADHLILYTLCNMKNAVSSFFKTNNDNDALSLNFLIINIYLLYINQN